MLTCIKFYTDYLYFSRAAFIASMFYSSSRFFKMSVILVDIIDVTYRCVIVYFLIAVTIVNPIYIYTNSKLI